MWSRRVPPCCSSCPIEAGAVYLPNDFNSYRVVSQLRPIGPITTKWNPTETKCNQLVLIVGKIFVYWTIFQSSGLCYWLWGSMLWGNVSDDSLVVSISSRPTAFDQVLLPAIVFNSSYFEYTCHWLDAALSKSPNLYAFCVWLVDWFW